MHKHQDLVDLTQVLLKQAKATGCPEVADEFRRLTMQYQDLVDLARIFLKQAKTTACLEVADEFHRLAKEYQSKAANIDGGILPDIGEE